LAGLVYGIGFNGRQRTHVYLNDRRRYMYMYIT
jgi:hypothetical protein